MSHAPYRKWLVFIYATIALPMSILVLSAFYATLPDTLGQAALVDGAGHGTIWWTVMTPHEAPGGRADRGHREMTDGNGPTLVVDLGKSGWRARAHFDVGIREAEGAPGVDTNTTGAEGAGSVLAGLVSAAATATLEGQAPGVVIVASTAIPSSTELERWASQLLAQWPATAVVIGEDGVMNHAAALAGPGVCASVGTGVIIVATDQRGGLARLDGWGPDLGDRGGAFDLGRAGLGAACAGEDGLLDAAELRDAARAHLGGLDLQSANRLAADPHRPAVMANFARTVCDLARHDGVSRQLVDDATTKVAQTIRAAAQRGDSATVALTGRLARHPIYREALEAQLVAVGLEMVAPRAEVLDLTSDVLLSEPYRAAVASFTARRSRGPS